ncbi:MBL fold metallo-hydrolase [Ktedonospora formicarum]|uniref:MBL fold hydrolase n=1 Tax=Ktedonospora formicarum TaxID=2778364 RepID=A0A8J3IAM8_9CHLR|nr:MBL fold metallo-hydrolase [Ktedonospora formicarum]GHO49132.1 MBL fold hydrolase [Ktedonospora formicarum]
MPEEIMPGLYRLPVSLLNASLGSVNMYVVASPDGGVRLIDCAWNRPEVYTILVDELRALGMGIGDIKEILLTHNHPDHIGLAERLVQETGARLLIHRLDATYFGRSAEDMQALRDAWIVWLRTCGMPLDELEALTARGARTGMRLPVCQPDVLLEGGERLEWNPFCFEVIWTPGHAPGLTCLYDPQFEILIASDHVLEHISPHIGRGSQQDDDPLSNYLRSLQAVRDLPVQVILPGHGQPFTGLAARVDALAEHHQRRLGAIMKALAGEEQTAYSVASRLVWRRSEKGWQQLSPFERMSAMDETLSHLEYLLNQGAVSKQLRNGVVTYQAIQSG